VIERVDATGKVLKVLTSGRASTAGACLPSGEVWFYANRDAKPTIMRCDGRGCRTLLEQAPFGLSVSPDGTRLAFTTVGPSHVTVAWMSVDGGTVHTVAATETACAAGWASSRALWVSRRRDGRIVWTEVDADSGAETGRAVPGLRDCSTGDPDPASPVNPDLPVVLRRQSQLRLIGNEHLGRH
jgi:hypothetical protein